MNVRLGRFNSSHLALNLQAPKLLLARLHSIDLALLLLMHAPVDCIPHYFLHQAILRHSRETTFWPPFEFWPPDAPTNRHDGEFTRPVGSYAGLLPVMVAIQPFPTGVLDRVPAVVTT